MNSLRFTLPAQPGAQTRPAILDIFPHGPLAVFLDSATGARVGVIDRVTGEAASLHYRPAYIGEACNRAHQAWASRADF